MNLSHLKFSTKLIFQQRVHLTIDFIESRSLMLFGNNHSSRGDGDNDEERKEKKEEALDDGDINTRQDSCINKKRQTLTVQRKTRK